jgi:hypothetical protein
MERQSNRQSAIFGKILIRPDVQERAVIRQSATFEAFAQRWTLNYILAKLESGS